MRNILEPIEKPEDFEKLRGMHGIEAVYGRTLCTKNTKDIFLCSSKDWLKANCCHWFLTYNGRIMNQAGIFYEDYVGINTPRKKITTDKFDFSRYNYEEPGYVEPKATRKSTGKKNKPRDKSGQAEKGSDSVSELPTKTSKQLL